MKTLLTLTASLLAANFLIAAETDSNAQIKNAIASLKKQSNYSWTAKIELPGMPFTPEPQHGKVSQEGIALVDQSFNDESMRAAFTTNKVVVLVEGQWQVVSNPDSGDFGDRAAMTARFLTRSGTAATEAENLLAKVKELKAGDDGLWSGDMTEKGAGELLTFGPRGEGPGPKNAKGSVKYWVKDGTLTKFQTHVSGVVSMFGQEEREMETTRTVEIQDLGKTKVEVPDAAKKLFEAK